MTALKPFDRLLQAHEQTTGHRAWRYGNQARLTCTVCRTMSLKVSAAIADNGNVLINSFCEHSSGEFLAAMGMQMADLFVRRDHRTMTPVESRQFRQDAVLSHMRAAWSELRKEATVVLIAGNQVQDGTPFTEADLTRLKVAALKIFDWIDSMEALNVR